MDFFELVNSRRSLRKFSDKRVEPEVIEKILDAALTAPSSRNSHSTKFLVIEDKDLITFKTQIDLETDKDGGCDQEELIAILDQMVKDGLSPDDAYIFFRSRYPTSDKNNPWRSYAP